MKHSILKPNDLVRYHVRNEALDSMGFVVGQFYMVSKFADGGLSYFVAVNANKAVLENDGALTDFADHFTKHQCPVTLPIGMLNKRGL